MGDLELDQDLTNLWPRYDYDVSQIVPKKYTIKWPWYDQPMTKIWPRILGLSYECNGVLNNRWNFTCQFFWPRLLQNSGPPLILKKKGMLPYSNGFSYGCPIH